MDIWNKKNMKINRISGRDRDLLQVVPTMTALTDLLSLGVPDTVIEKY